MAEDLYAYCCEWSSSHKGKDPAKVCDDYPELMKRVLTDKFKLSEAAVTSFIMDACFGNWEKLHSTTIEKSADARAYADEIVGDVWYSSDRWSWDRVLRIQWMYQRLFDRVRRNVGVGNGRS